MDWSSGSCIVSSGVSCVCAHPIRSLFLRGRRSPVALLADTSGRRLPAPMLGGCGHILQSQFQQEHFEREQHQLVVSKDGYSTKVLSHLLSFCLSKPTCEVGGVGFGSIPPMPTPRLGWRKPLFLRSHSYDWKGEGFLILPQRCLFPTL